VGTVVVVGGAVVVVGVVVVVGTVVVVGVVVEVGVVVVDVGVVEEVLAVVGVGGLAPNSRRYAAAPSGNCSVISRCNPSVASNSKYIWNATLCDAIQLYMLWTKYALSPPPWPSVRIANPHSGSAIG